MSHSVGTCKQTLKDYSCQNSSKWKDVQRQMEWFKLILQKNVELSQRNKPSHVILGDDS